MLSQLREKLCLIVCLKPATIEVIPTIPTPEP